MSACLASEPGDQNPQSEDVQPSDAQQQVTSQTDDHSSEQVT